MIYKILKKIKNITQKIREKNRVDKKIKYLINYKDNFKFGSPDWLSLCEIDMGGYISNVKRNSVSDLDSRTSQDINKGGMIGGDRMIHHNYASIYAEYLKPWIEKNSDFILIECGILKGTGLAVWSKLFPNSTLIGLDIDMKNIKENLNELKNRGAFKYKNPILIKFDQLKPDTNEIIRHLNGRKIEVFIDDGLHSEKAIINTFESIREFLNDNFIYFVEDNNFLSNKLKKLYPKFDIISYGEMTVIRPLK